MDNGSAPTMILGLDGLVLLAVSERDGELEQAVETMATAARCVVHVGGATSCPPPGVGARPSHLGSPGNPGVGQAGVALPRAGLPGADVDRAASGDLTGVVVDRAGPG